MVRCLCSLTIVAAIVASLALTAVADIPPPPPERGLKRVPYENVLKLEKEIPGYKFYTFQRMGIRGADKIVEELKLGTEKGIVVPSTSSPSVRTGVIAVPVKVMDELQTNENLAKLLSHDNEEKLPAGVVVLDTRGTTRDVKENDPRSKVENVITISADEKAGVKFTAAEAPAPASKDGSQSSAQPPAGMLLGGIALSVAAVTAGLWWFRRR